MIGHLRLNLIRPGDDTMKSEYSRTESKRFYFPTPEQPLVAEYDAPAERGADSSVSESKRLPAVSDPVLSRLFPGKELGRDRIDPPESDFSQYQQCHRAGDPADTGGGNGPFVYPADPVPEYTPGPAEKKRFTSSFPRFYPRKKRGSNLPAATTPSCTSSSINISRRCSSESNMYTLNLPRCSA